MKKRTLPLLLSLAIAPTAFAALKLNGVTIDDFKIEHSGGNVYITTTGGNQTGGGDTGGGDTGGGDTGGGDTGGGDTGGGDDPTPPIDTGSCGSENQDMVFETLNWSKQTGQVVLSMEGNTTSSSKFTTTSSTAYAGTIALGATTGGGNVTRNVWISTCPGGPAVAQTYNGCNISSTEVALKWSQEASPRIPTTCKLEANKVYYINYRNKNCSKASCDAFRNTYTNGRN